MNKKLLIIIGIIGLIAVVIGIVLLNRKEDDPTIKDNPGTEINDKSNNNIDDQNFTEKVDESEIVVQKYTFTEDNGFYFAELEFLNKTDKDIDLSDYMIHFYDSKGNELDSINGAFVGTVPARLVITSTIEVQKDLSSATQFVIKK